MAGTAQATHHTIPLPRGPAWGWPTKPKSRPNAIGLVRMGQESSIVNLPLGAPSGVIVKRRALTNPPSWVLYPRKSAHQHSLHARGA
eukprot:3520453-Amphidinium_carterae.2